MYPKIAVQILGYAGGVIMAVQNIPLLWKVWKTKSAHDLSYSTLAMTIVGGSLTLTYGVMIDEPPIYGTLAFSMSNVIALIVLKRLYTIRPSVV